MGKFYLNTDGGSRGNPGPAGAGIVITDATGRPLKKNCKTLGVMTNNEAEYQAVLFGLENLKQLVSKIRRGETEVEVRLDSELVAKQLSGQYQIKEEKLIPLFIKVWNARVADWPRLRFASIAREENKEADRLANEAIDKGEQKKLF